MQYAKIRHFILAGEVSRKGPGIVKNCEQETIRAQPAAAPGSSHDSNRKPVKLRLRLRRRRRRRQILPRRNRRHIGHARNLALGGIVDTDAGIVEGCAHGAFEFNARLSDPLWDGARFDATAADKYPYLYAGLSDVTALAETLLRDIASDERGYRVVPNDKALGRRISRLTLTQDLGMVKIGRAHV